MTIAPSAAAPSVGGLLDILDPEQRAAATLPDGPAQIITPAGSGKTTTLAAPLPEVAQLDTWLSAWKVERRPPPPDAAAVLSAYEALLAARNACDFDDLVVGAANRLETDLQTSRALAGAVQPHLRGRVPGRRRGAAPLGAHPGRARAKLFVVRRRRPDDLCLAARGRQGGRLTNVSSASVEQWEL
jgi:hypothetical protein